MILFSRAKRSEVTSSPSWWRAWNIGLDGNRAMMSYELLQLQQSNRSTKTWPISYFLTPDYLQQLLCILNRLYVSSFQLWISENKFVPYFALKEVSILLIESNWLTWRIYSKNIQPSLSSLLLSPDLEVGLFVLESNMIRACLPCLSD